MAAATTTEFLDALEKSGLLPAADLEEVRRRAAAEASDESQAEPFARGLVESHLLTKLQAKQLLSKRHRGFFIGGKYKILDMLGEGGMGRVLLCEHLLLRRLVALKLMHGPVGKQASAVDRFLREARAAASLHHVNIAQVFDVDLAERGPYIVMEYVDGVDLHRLTEKHCVLPIERTVHYIRQAAAGLQHAHQAGLVHRDIKPVNLMLDRVGEVKLLDLGLARFFNPDKNDKLTQDYDPSSVLGTADFISPEQILNSSTADIRCDIYSLGMTLYFLLAGKVPFGEGQSIQKLMWQQTKEPEPIENLRPEVPPGLAAVLTKMIRKNPSDRYATPAAVVQALAPFNKTKIALPPASEMPSTLPGDYRLGISPLPPVNVPAERPATRASGSDLAVRAHGSVPSHAPDGEHHKSGERSHASKSATARSAHERSGIETPSELQRSTPTSPSTMPRNSGLPDDDEVLLTASENSAEMSTALGSVRNLLTRLDSKVHLAAVAAGMLIMILSVVIWKAWQGADAPKPEQPVASSVEATGTAHNPVTPPAAPAAEVMLHGGGSTFVKPIMEVWTKRYQEFSGVRVGYTAVGSSKGIDGATSQLLDFGCSDVFLTDEQLAAAGKKMLHVPLVLGAVVPTYNVPLADNVPLRFSGPILAQIYLGRITHWNDRAIAVNNPSVKLPDLPIVPVYRSDGSGTTAIWTEYLSKASAEWKSQIGAGAKVKWTIGKAAEKSDGMADAVSRTTGAIGYVELSYSLANGLPFGQVKNAEGNFITPSIDSVTLAAAASLQVIPPDLRYSLTDAPGPGSYPIVGTAWALLYAEQPHGKSKELARFLRWSITDGQQFVGDLHYGRLPPKLAAKAKESLDTMISGR